MRHHYFITIDVGTSSTKSGLWRDDGLLVAEATGDYQLRRPRPAWAEIVPVSNGGQLARRSANCLRRGR